MDSDGSNQVNISNAGGNDVNPQWSPDGTKIVFRSSRFGGSEIMTMDPDGSNQARLTTNKDGNDPSWSPDGAKIVYAEAPSGINQDIYIMNADGSNPIRLTTHSSQDYNPDWGP